MFQSLDTTWSTIKAPVLLSRTAWQTRGGSVLSRTQKLLEPMLSVHAQPPAPAGGQVMPVQSPEQKHAREDTGFVMRSKLYGQYRLDELNVLSNQPEIMRHQATVCPEPRRRAPSENAPFDGAQGERNVSFILIAYLVDRRWEVRRRHDSALEGVARCP